MPGYDSYVKALLHMNGDDASQTFVDETGKAVTAGGTAQIDTAQKVFGTGSCLLDGNSDYVSLLDSDDWYLSNGNWTIDFWVRFNNVGTQTGLFHQYADAQNYLTCYFGGSPIDQLNILFRDANTERFQYGYVWSPSVNTWYHLEFVRNGTSLLLFQAGVLKSWTYSTTAIGSNVLGNIAAPLEIGRGQQPGDTVRYTNGWIDEFRWSKGVARHTADFSVPTEEYALETFRQQAIII